VVVLDVECAAKFSYRDRRFGMRVRQLPASPLYSKIRFAFADHPIIVWADVILLRLSLEPIGLRNGK